MFSVMINLENNKRSDSLKALANQARITDYPASSLKVRKSSRNQTNPTISRTVRWCNASSYPSMKKWQCKKLPTHFHIEDNYLYSININLCTFWVAHTYLFTPRLHFVWEIFHNYSASNQRCYPIAKCGTYSRALKSKKNNWISNHSAVRKSIVQKLHQKLADIDRYQSYSYWLTNVTSHDWESHVKIKYSASIQTMKAVSLSVSQVLTQGTWTSDRNKQSRCQQSASTEPYRHANDKGGTNIYASKLPQC